MSPLCTIRRIARSKASRTRRCGRRIADHRALVSENVRDFRRLEAHALAAAQPRPPLIFTTDRQFPRGDPATIGRLVTELDALLTAEPDLVTAMFLKPA